MRIVNSLDNDTWKTFVDENPQGNIFQTPEMHAVLSCVKDYHPTLWATLGNDGQLLALFLPVQVSLFGGPLKFFTTRSVSFGSVLTTGDRFGHAALALLLQTYNQRTSAWPIFTELRNHSDLSEIQNVLHRQGYLYEDHLNYLIDLQREPEIILKSFSEDARRRIRRNVKRGVVTVKDVTSRSQLATVYALLQKTYQRVQIPLADISLFEAAFDVLLPKKMVRFTLAYVDEMPVTASVSLLYKDVIYGWYTGTDRAYRNYGPNEFEVWELINWGIEHGYRILDFGGAGRPDEKYGVRDFKAKFNGQLVNYGRYAYIHDPLRMKLSEVSYGLARNSMKALQNMRKRFISANKTTELS
jgi:serine/alanine adding enzyme